MSDKRYYAGNTAPAYDIKKENERADAARKLVFPRAKAKNGRKRIQIVICSVCGLIIAGSLAIAGISYNGEVKSNAELAERHSAVNSSQAKRSEYLGYYNTRLNNTNIAKYAEDKLCMILSDDENTVNVTLTAVETDDGAETETASPDDEITDGREQTDTEGE